MLCVPLTVTSKKEISKFLSAANKHADCIELRLDYFRRKPDVKKLVASCKKPVIVTVRKKSEGGKHRYSAKDRLALYREAIRMQVDYVDIELSSGSLIAGVEKVLEGSRTQLIVSYHDFRSTDKKVLLGVYRRMKKIPDAIMKIATHAQEIEDNVVLFELLKQAKKDRREMIGLCMGDVGKVSRLLGLAQGSLLTYTSLGTGSAPGQISLREMKELYRLDVLKQPKVFGLVGNPVAHSTGYVFHNENFARKRKQALYVNFLAKDIASFLGAFAPYVSGLSVTLPHKETIVGCLDKVDRDAAAIGAVNTVVKRAGKLTGYNTDFLGVLAALRKTPLKGKHVLVLGAGGVARATCYAVARKGATITVVNRTHSKAITLADSFEGEALPMGMLVASPGFDVIINCTLLGMAPRVSESPLTKAMLKKISKSSTVVFDTVYTPEHTTLLKCAGSLGLRTVTGVHLFNEQAKAQYNHWRHVL